MMRPGALVACGMAVAVTVLATTGCGAQRRTAAGCAAFTVGALRAHREITEVPAPCRRLGAVALSQAVRIAVGDVADHGGKAERRRLAAGALARMSGLVTAARRAAAQAEAAGRRRAARDCTRRPDCGAGLGAGASGIRIPVGAAALAAWLLTAASGTVLLARSIAHRPGRRRGSHGLPPALILSHFGLAVAGLLTWISFLATDWVPLAWTATSILLPVAGLGMSTLVSPIPEPDRDPGRAEGSGGSSPRAGTAGGSGGSSPRAGTDPAPAAATPARTRAPVVMIAAHGVLATATVMLALLGSVAALGSR